ncbi:MAG TPA: aminotransferase class I/II-fold pyridoxal phosphate-dependent enzyme [Vicinamibacterales bacterium]|nr:aminotransferase class I/II-fold pyridoxal phosphate-dependent enzyme [Vicinamibacterales bacterium]
MSVTRRNFFRTVGLGSAGLSTSVLVGRSREALAFPAPFAAPDDSGVIRVSNNENNRGPGRKTIDALHSAITVRVGRGYPPDYTNDLVDTIAGIYGVSRTSVIVGTGSGPILEGAVRAFGAPDKPVVSAAPTYATAENMARRLNVPVKLVPVDRTSLQLDLGAMAEASKGAGLVYICNPNNPTGGAHSAAAIEQFVRRVKESSPGTAILIDEAYIDYAHDASIKTAAPLAKELPGVFITRSFSKAHGMAGLRLGYAVGQPDTVGAIPKVWQLGSINTLTAAAGIASLKDTAHIAEEVAENARVRTFTMQAFKDMGFPAIDSHANCIFVDVKQSAAQFRDACMAMKIQVGRDFPPYEKSHSRITLGTMDEMRQAVDVFRKVLGAKTTSSSAQ